MKPADMSQTDAQSISAESQPAAWQLVWGQPYIDADKLAAALENELAGGERRDFRTRLLVRDAAVALRSYWGSDRFTQWLTNSPVGEKIKAILSEDLGQTGYHHIRRRLVTSIGKEQLEQVFDLLGRHIPDKVEVYIAGSMPTLLGGLTYRPTDDIDFVDEVPAAIRQQHEVIDQIHRKYGLTLGHVQSHYLPSGWQTRRQYLGDYGGLRVFLVDVYDVFVSKLSSKQEKHLDDLRVMAPRLDKEKVRRRLLEHGRAFLESEFDRPTIEANWRFLWREPLIVEDAEEK